jgi:hypothetical protein
MMINCKTTVYAILICALAAANVAFAEPSEENQAAARANRNRDETRFRMSGTTEVGFDINNRVDRDEVRYNKIGKGALDISARPVGRVRAELGIEYNMRDTFVVIDKMYGQYNITNDGTIRAGIMKKSFGLEERAGIEERYFTRRSIINSGIEDLGFLGHDLTLLYRHDVSPALRLQGSLSWSTEDSLRYLQNYSATYNMNDNLMFVLATIIMHYGDPDEWLSTSFVSSLSARHTLPGLISEAELTFGVNPNPRTVWIEDRYAYIFGLRVQERFPIATPWKTLRQIVPLVEAALYWDDFQSGNLDTQIRAGLMLGFAKNSAFQFRNTFGTVIRTFDGESNVRQYRYDSQVLVIF